MRGNSPPSSSRHDQQEQSPTPALVGDPVPNPSRQPRRGRASSPPIPFNRIPVLTISFHEPERSPETTTPEDPSQATVATAHTVTGTPFK